MELNAAIIELLKSQAEVIRYETEENRNTAERVGAMFVAIIEQLNKLIDLSDKYLKKHEKDTADALITFLAGINIGEFIPNVSGANLDEEGNAELRSLIVRLDSVFKERLSSPDFISGFLSGKGWSIMKDKVLNALGIPENKYTLEIDNIIVRGSLRVYEMIVSQLLGENDNRIFTAMLEVDHYDPETGKIWLDTQGGKMYNPFRKGDYIMVQQYNGMPSEDNGYYVTKGYELIITNVGIGNLADGENRLDWVEFANFTTTMEGGTPDELITKGDTLVRVDNATDPNRKGIIQIITVGEKTPYFDVIYGRKTDPDNYLKGRLGNLEGIRHQLFGWLQGFGEYLTNLYAVGDFRLRRTGDDLDAQIEMLKSQFASRYSSLTYDITEEDNYLYNATFTENMDGWEVLRDTAKIIVANSDALLMNGNLYLSDSSVSDSTKRATLSTYDGKQMLYLYDSGIIQRNSYIRKPETHKVYDESAKNSSTWDQSVTDNLKDDYSIEKDTLYLEIKFLALKSGTLTIGFQGASGDGNSLPNPTNVEVSSSLEWQTLYWKGTWDGKGDFILSFTGEMYVSQLAVTSDPLSDYKKEIGTQIIQTANNIKLIGYNIDAKAGKMTDLGLEINAVDASIRLWVNTEIRDEYTNLIKGTELKLTEDMASLKATLEKEFKDADDQLKKLIEEAGLEITSEMAKLYATKEEVNQVTGDIKNSIAALEVRADKIEGRVTTVENGLVTANSKITQTAAEIRAEVQNIKEGLESSISQTAEQIRSEVKNSISGLQSQITQNADSITSVVKDLKGMQSQITQNATNINLKVSKGDVINQINLDTSGVKIDASKVQIIGDFTVNNVFQITSDGQISFKGISRFSTAYKGNISNYQIFYIPSGADSTQYLTMGYEKEDVGKVVWLFNGEPLGGLVHYIQGCSFNISGGGRVQGIDYSVAPQEAIEFTCFQTSENKAEWIMTNRLSYQQFRNVPTMGRYPLCWAMGTITYNHETKSISVSGTRYDGKSLSSIMRPLRTGIGRYQVTFDEGTFPSSYFVFTQPSLTFDTDEVTPHDSASSVNVRGRYSNAIIFYCSDDSSFNDASFDFIIFSTVNWYYNA